MRLRAVRRGAPAGSGQAGRGRYLSHGEGVAFWALAEIVRQRLGIAQEDLAEAATAKLAAGLDPFVPDSGERAFIGPRLARLLGISFGGPDGTALAREELFAGWPLFFERLAAVQRVICSSLRRVICRWVPPVVAAPARDWSEAVFCLRLRRDGGEEVD